MRITRAAKVAAFPLTALILVALIACQGPAGPAGTDGATDTAAAGAIKAKVDGSMLEYTLTTPGSWTDASFQDSVGAGTVDRLFTDGFMATVRATDSDIAAEATVTIMLNRKPMVIGADTAGTSGVVDASESADGEATLTLGIQDLKRRNAANDADAPLTEVTGFHKECAKIQECVLNLTCSRTTATSW